MNHYKQNIINTGKRVEIRERVYYVKTIPNRRYNGKSDKRQTVNQIVRFDGRAA